MTNIGSPSPSPSPSAVPVSPVDATGGGVPGGGADGAPLRERSASLWADAGRQLIRSPIFLGACGYILVIVSMAVVPWLWTSKNPRLCVIQEARQGPSSEHWFGTSIVGCDYYAHAIYGARTSLLLAVTATAGVTLLGGVMGMLAGYYGRWVDAIISRVIDIILALPFLLGAIVFLTVVKIREWWMISIIIIMLAWTVIARIMRGSVLASKNLDYVQAAKALGASHRRLMFKHILPNAVAPMLVYATILLGSFVAAEATLTFLGVGLQAPAVTWGVMITQHEAYFLQHPGLLLFPAGLLFGTVLAFILIGDALRDALDPRLQ